MAEKKILDQQFYFKGADSDTNPELVQTEKGRYVDAKNVRPQSTDGNSGALQKIKGELIDYTFAGYDDYTCIGACGCKGYKVVFWAKDGSDSFISIDDDIVCESSDLPTTYNHPLQIAVNENCLGGEVFPTDFNVAPMIFDVKDMVDSFDAGSDKYFADFDLSQYTVQLKRQLDMPMFVELVSRGTNGLKSGHYAYALRYVDTAGNRTQWSMLTPLIPVIGKVEFNNASPYPNTKTYGADGGLSCPYGIKLKFRIFNEHNYSHIEIKRISLTNEAVLGYVPVSEVTEYLIPLADGESRIEDDFVDDATVIWTEVTDQEDTQTFNTVDTAKAVRYYQNKLILMNIKYVSKNLEDSDIEFLESNSGNYMYPFKNKLGGDGTSSLHTDGTIGYKDPYNSTYHKHYMGGETYGFAMLCFGANGDRAFVVPIPENSVSVATDGITMPNRRDKVEGDSNYLTNSLWKGCVNRSVDVNNVTDTDTFEVSDITETPRAKTGTGSTEYSLSTDGGHTYNVLNPKSQDDVDVADHEFRVNPQISLNSGTHANIRDNGVYYNPSGFTPQYYSTGIAIEGVTGLPDWVEAFTIVRTAPAGRVVAQGLATYHNLSLNINNSSFFDFISKAKDKIKFVSDDLNFFAREITSDHKVQFVSPIGMFSEVYMSAYGSHSSDFGGSLGNNVYRGVEMISYARVVDNNASISPSLQRQGGDENFFTEYGRWRNTVIGGIAHPFYDASAPNNTNGNRPFGINSVSLENLKSGRGDWWSIELDDDLYGYDGLGLANVDINHVDSQNYAEPIYIANIIDEDAALPDNNVNSYIETGHYQKIKSVIGIFNMANTTSFNLVDERIEDCAPFNYLAPAPASISNYFIYIEDPNTHKERAWLNVENKTQVQIEDILDEIVLNGFYEADIGGGNHVNAYGVYWHSYNERGSLIFFEFPAIYSAYVSAAPEYFFPSDDSKVIVRYDNRAPLKVFGGDCSIGETVGATVDELYDNDGDPINEYPLYRGMPYMTYKYSDNYQRINNAANTLNMYQFDGSGWGSVTAGFNYAILEFLRQHVWMYTAESRCHIPYMFDTPTNHNLERFPSIHYIMRPEKWDTTDIDVNNFGGGKLSATYLTDYPNETLWWEYGGLLFGNQENIGDVTNSDYSTWNTASMAFTKPAVGYEEKNAFCSLVIWSEPRLINEQNSPSLRSFPSGNALAISDAQGAIKFAYDTETSKGENLYAITNNGICLLLTGKTTMADAIGNTIGYTTPIDGFIQSELWLSKDIGMNDEMWRSVAEYKKALFFANQMSVYMMFDNQITDIAKDHKYYNRVYGDGLSTIESGYTTPVTGVVDKLNEEYWLNIKQTKDIILMDNPVTISPYYLLIGDTFAHDYLATPSNIYEVASYCDTVHVLYLPATLFNIGEYMYLVNSSINDITVHHTNQYSTITTLVARTGKAKVTWNGSGWDTGDGIGIRETFVYGIKGQSWYGTYDYYGERFISIGDSVYSVKETSVYALGVGYDIDGSNIQAEIINVSAPSQMAGKEFIDIKIASDQKPDRIDFATSLTTMSECFLAESMSVPANAYYLKDYNGWYNFIPRKLAGDRDRVQNTSCFYRIRYDGATEFNLIDSIVGSKILKIQ